MMTTNPGDQSLHGDAPEPASRESSQPRATAAEATASMAVRACGFAIAYWTIDAHGVVAPHNIEEWGCTRGSDETGDLS